MIVGVPKVPYVLAIANQGVDGAVAADPALALGVNTWDGAVTNAAVAETHGMGSIALTELMS